MKDMPKTVSDYKINDSNYNSIQNYRCPFCNKTNHNNVIEAIKTPINQNPDDTTTFVHLYALKCNEYQCHKISLWGYLKDDELQLCGNNTSGSFIMIFPNTSPIYLIQPHEYMHEDIKAIFIGAQTLIEQKNFTMAINLLSQAIHKLGIPESNNLLQFKEGDELDLARKMFNFINNSVELLDQTRKSSTNVSE